MKACILPEQSHKRKTLHLRRARWAVQRPFILLIRRGAAVLHQLEQFAVAFKVEITQFASLSFLVDAVVVNLLLELADGERVVGWSHCRRGG